MKRSLANLQIACSGLPEDIEEEQLDESGEDVELAVEIPIVDSGSYVYVCEECGAGLTEIPYYNRYYCESCGLHY